MGPTDSWNRRLLCLAAAAAVALAACGGAAAPGATQDGQNTTGPGGPGATAGADATPGGPGATASGPGASTSAGVPADACTLLTVNEVAGALSTDPVLTAGPDPDFTPGCLFALPADDHV